MDSFHPDGPWLLSRDALTPLDRALFGVLAVAPLAALVDLVIRPWPAILAPGGLVLLPLVLGALAVSVVLATAAILAPVRHILVDPSARVVIDTGRARWLGRRGRRIPFDEIEEVALRKDYDTEGTDRLQLVLVLRHRRLPWALLHRPATRRAELEALAARLRAALQP